MIEGIVRIGAVAAYTPSVGHGTERRQKRLKWLSSLRAALDEAGPLVDDMGADGPEIPYTRAQIADALDLVEEMRARLGNGQDSGTEADAGSAISASELAKRIAASADRSLAVQAHIGAAAVRRYVAGQDENPR